MEAAPAGMAPPLQASRLVTLRPQRGVELQAVGVTYTVKDHKSGQQLDLLKGVSATFSPGRLTAVMGNSGSGKSTLLDVLAGNTYGGCTVGGRVLVNGRPRDPAAFAALSSYVLQRDVLDACATVREAVTLSALLKLGPEVPLADKMERVDAALQELDLASCQHTLIGDDLLLRKGISGGQRRRVSVALELVKVPSVLLLDEPTSGLDSENAAALVGKLSALSRQNRTIVATLHQPSSQICSLFDDFVLLHGGACVYAGPWAGAVPYFAAAGHPCPQYVNPPDHFISLLKSHGDALVAAWASQAQRGPSDLEEGAAQEGWLASAGCDVTVRVLSGPGSSPERPCKAAEAAPSQAAPSQAQPAPRVPWCTQVSLLTRRMLRQWLRSPHQLASEAGQYIFLALFYGLLWLQLTNEFAEGTKARACSLWFAMAILCLVPSATAVTVWDRDRALLRREAQRGLYDVSAWYAARTLVAWPMQLAQVALFSAVMYWMIGFAPTAANFWIFTGIFCLFQLCSETIGEMCAAATRSSTHGAVVLSLVMTVFLPLAGYLVTDVPVYLRWLQTASYARYAYAAVLQNELVAVAFDLGGKPIPGAWVWEPSAAPPVPELRQALEMTTIESANNGLSVGENAAVLAGITVAVRCLAGALLWGLHRAKRL